MDQCLDRGPQRFADAVAGALDVDPAVALKHHDRIGVGARQPDASAEHVAPRVDQDLAVIHQGL